ncbi:fluoride efflux transporter FluC [Sphingosinicella terrae]|uniref:fluoride efflux transporter FluC n=1 Tax=Sphingosinicella terrae TaxID=2172047 RepID=UPI000E0D0A26|nr:CrcB family protein [Sphingosinicella terrae]
MLAHLLSFAAIAVGGAAGAAARFWLAGRIDRSVGGALGLGTLCVNVSGCAAIGLLSILLDGSSGNQPSLWPLLVTGLLGSYTTVSAFSLQALLLFEDRRLGAALAHIAASLLLCLAAAAGGRIFGLLVA